MTALTTNFRTTPSPPTSSAPPPSSDHSSYVGQTSLVAAGPSAPAMLEPIPRHGTPGQPLASDQAPPVAQTSSVAGDPSSPAKVIPNPSGESPGSSSAPDHLPFGSHAGVVGGDLPQSPSIEGPNNQSLIDGGWAELRLWAEILEDIQKTRKANYNRIGEDGEGRSFRLNVDPDQYRPFLAMIDGAEHEAWKNLVGSYRRVVPQSIQSWQKGARGVGEKRMARILGHLGDPCIATPHRWEGTGKARTLLVGEPRYRTVAQLWAYCGVGDPGRKHKAGISADELFACGSTFLKSQLWNMGCEIVKVGGGGEYRPVYDEARERYADRIHSDECKQCHAKPGDPWKPGHQHNAALRFLSKRVLKDLWLARREDLPTDQTRIDGDVHVPAVGG